MYKYMYMCISYFWRTYTCFLVSMSCSTARGPALALRVKWASRLMNGIDDVPINCEEILFKVRYIIRLFA